MSSESTPGTKEQLSRLFGSYKAEWLKDQLYELYTEPSYMPELETSRPCLLEGGRGTGKTTVLRSLSYEGQYKLRKKTDGSRRGVQTYYGFYYRVNTNRVTAFRGVELSEERWALLFAHYVNLLLVGLVIDFLVWFERIHETTLNLGVEDTNRLYRSFNISLDNGGSPTTVTLKELGDRILDLQISFEAFINNVVDAQQPEISMQAVPLDTLFLALRKLPEFRDKNFFFLIDEYENFENYQQRVVNTLIKHSGDLYTFKVGVREGGLKEKSTLSRDEQLISPSDYVHVNIADKLSGSLFNDFARMICNDRIRRIQGEKPIIRDIRELFPEMSEDSEAEKLGISSQVYDIRGKLRPSLADPIAAKLDELSQLEVYFLKYWADSNRISLAQSWEERNKDEAQWNTRFNNYKHALLFTVRKRKAGLRKYYSGWEVFLKLASKNIRYLLELVDQCLIAHLTEENSLSEPVSAETQTITAQRVGRKNLNELEGLSVNGGQLTKLLLSLGRVFQVMAADPYGHAPEVNQFRLSADAVNPEARDILNAAVMHLALLRQSGNKLGSEADTKEHDYMIHPIFSPFFEFSYRRKRKMTISSDQLINLIRRPRPTIREVLAQSGRDDIDKDLPQQMSLFETYYYGQDS